MFTGRKKIMFAEAEDNSCQSEYIENELINGIVLTLDYRVVFFFIIMLLLW